LGNKDDKGIHSQNIRKRKKKESYCSPETGIRRKKRSFRSKSKNIGFSLYNARERGGLPDYALEEGRKEGSGVLRILGRKGKRHGISSKFSRRKGRKKGGGRAASNFARVDERREKRNTSHNLSSFL